MSFTLKFTPTAVGHYEHLQKEISLGKSLKAIQKCLGFLEANPRHPGLNTHKYHSLSAQYGVEIFEDYAENKTPGAYRIFWHYGPDKKTITVIAITPHP